MRAGIACLVLAYVLSQFYRAFLAVLTPVLKTELGATSEDLAAASGIWFLAFALMQFPVGWALDRVGPRLTSMVLLGAGGAGGALVFGMAQGPAAILAAMALIGIGCSPVLMASYYIFARSYSPAVFGTLAAAVVGIGSLGNIAGSVPLAWAVEAFGWRETLFALAGVTLGVAGAIGLLVRDPGRIEGSANGSLWQLLRMPALWPVLIMMVVCYAPAAGLRGLWIGPYYADVFGASAVEIGRATLVMGLAMVAGSFAYGPLDRLLGTRKGLILGGNLLAALCLIALWIWPVAGGWTGLLLFAGIGLFGASFPMVIAHGRAFVPPHLMGRGVTLLNFFGIASPGIMQFATGAVHGAVAPVPPEAPYEALFLFFALFILAGCAVYAFSGDRTD
ncbi:MFS transporter [Cereibacter azotoformans]|uniref:Sugar phosphate permease n=1 Tax=Cereibacter azotoformans TaxID=43057 RepID=A0A2T5JU66_9RHOB|nr:MFS transporter [Cereibacter azotoformans]AXQ92360.1 MFS transporter [Cereibacter sphaeroides]MBO4170074.1 MFS transporter [Cereibacter azotoformans]PTR13705.1 sugar phosphate permease [Cereibacter azotoformans]UIJ30629.1 MFS transporter [Cereibacter azotoformans]